MFITNYKNHIRFIGLLVFALLNFSVKAQLRADFTADITEGCTPLIVQFTDVSEGGPTEWTWDFGNGSSSNQQNPGIIYIEPGSYTIKLAIKNANGEDSAVKTSFINVYPKPDVNFTASPLSGCAPLQVNFTDQSTTSNGTIVNWIWDFGDGTTSGVQNPVHIYNLSDTFNVTLIVTNSFGCKQTLLKPAYIAVADTVQAGFTYTYTSGCRLPTALSFINTSVSGSPLSFMWSFGDGGSSVQNNPAYTYTVAGLYDVTLVATNSAGCTDTVVQQLSLGSLQADFSAPAAACVNESIVMQDSSNPVAINGVWDFGDGTGATGLTVSHVYSNTGIYSIFYKAGFGGCTNAITKTIEISDKPAASFSSASLLSKCQAPLTVQFDNGSAGAVSYIWDFGDGTTSTDINPVHTYTERGNFTVKLIAANASGGCADSIIKPGFVRINPPNITGFNNLPVNGCAPLDVSFSAAVSSSEPVAGYLWHFGDGTNSDLITPLHTFINPGVYDVSLLVTTTGGCTDSFSMTKAVTVTAKPVADFKAEPLTACASSEIQFTDLTNGTVDSWLWRFGDGGLSTAKNPLHEYEDTGKFTITLYVTINGCQDSVIFKDYVQINPPVASFEPLIECSNRFLRSFRDESVGAETWTWAFGDGDSSNEQNPAHTYLSTGTYEARLIVTNGGCADTTAFPVYIIDENPSFSIEAVNRNFCRYDSVKFIAAGYNTASLTGFKWDFGDGDTTAFSSAYNEIYHKYLQSGTYLPLLTTIDLNGCLDTVYSAKAITVFGPIASFTSPEGTCKGLTFTFNDASTGDGTNPLKEWLWDFGDGNTETFTQQPFSHIYTDSGTYDIKLIIYDTNGCTDTLLKEDAVIIAGPISDFLVLDSIRCTSNEVSFINNSAGIQLSYLWDFGDGIRSTKKNPVNIYASQGIYTVSLKVTDRFGCKDSTEKAGAVSISNPIADFSISDSAASCPPLPVQVKNTSENYSGVLWDFGDGNTSTQFEPFRLYTTPGEYTLQLVVHGFGECYDTLSKHISLKGPSGSFSYTPAAGCFPLEHTFKAVATNTSSYVWDFGDGTTEVTTKANITYRYKAPGLYVPKLILQDLGGCSVPIEQNDTLKVSGVEPAFLSEISTGCDSTLVTFTDSSLVTSFDPIVKRLINFGDGNSSADINAVHYYKKSGTYNVVLSLETATGCRGTFAENISLVVNPAPVINAVFVDSACLKTIVNFTAKDEAAIPDPVEWQWDFGNNDISTEQNPVYAYNAAGLYRVSVLSKSSKGCTDTFSKSIHILPPPDLGAGVNTIICLNQSVTLQPTGAFSYVWESSGSLSCTNCVNPVAAPVVTTTYYVTGDNNFGCETSDSVTVQVIQPTNLSLSVNGDTLCQGSSVLLIASGAEKYNWQPSAGLSNINIPNPVASPVSTTVYTVIGSDNNNCFADTAEVSILVAPIPTFNIVDTTATLSAGSSYTIQTTNSPDVVAWIWQPPYNLSCNNCAQPATIAKTNVTYAAQAITKFGCTASDVISIIVTCSDRNIFIPNTFSPNGDARNDQFYPQGKGLFTIKSLKIFNRWGVLVFSKANFGANNPSDGWNGKYNGADQPAGVYVYTMDVLCENGTVLNYKGDITLLR